MSSSLSGGLVPINTRASARSTSSTPTVDFDEQHQQRAVDGGRSSGWDGEEEGSSSGLQEKKSKKTPSGSRRRGSKNRGGSGHELSSHRRRRGAQATREKAFDDSSLLAGLEDSGGGFKEGREKSSSPSNLKLGPAAAAADVEEEDDSYLFMGATAGVKGKKSTGGDAAEEAFNYDSCDSFGLPKAKPKSVKDFSPKPAHGETGSRNAFASTERSGADADPSGPNEDSRNGGNLSSRRGRGAQPPTSATGLGPGLGTTTSTGLEEFPSTAGIATAAQVMGSSSKSTSAMPTGTGAALGEDFDSADEGIDDMLQMTDPSTLVAASSSSPAPAQAPAVTAILSPLGKTAERSSVSEKDLTASRQRVSGTTALSPAIAAPALKGEDSAARARADDMSRLRSPSPPSSPRGERRNRDSLRSRPGRGLAYSGSGVGVKGGGLFEEDPEGKGKSGGLERSSDNTSHGAAEPAATNAVIAEPGQATINLAGSSMRASSTWSGGDGGSRARNEALLKEDHVGSNARREVMESDSLLQGSDLRESASASSGGGAGLSLGREGSASDTRQQLTSSSPEFVLKTSGRVPRRSTLAGVDKPKSQSKASRAVTFEDDLAEVDALDILPGSSSDEGDKRSGSSNTPATKVTDTTSSVAKPASAFQEKPPPLVGTAEPAVDTVAHESDNSGEALRGLESRAAALSSGESRRFSAAAMTAGLSPDAARQMAEDSSSEDSSAPAAGRTSAIASLLGLDDSRPPPTEGGGGGHQDIGVEAKKKGQALKQRGDGGSMTTSDNARLDLALGFTPSAMDGGRKPRRALPAGRRRRSLAGSLPAPVGVDGNHTEVPNAKASPAPTPPVLEPPSTAPTLQMSITPCEDAPPATVSTPPAATTATSLAVVTSLAGASPSVWPSPSSKASSSAAVSQPFSNAATAIHGGSSTCSDLGLRSGGSIHTSNAPSIPATGPLRENTSVESRGVDASVLASLERQLVLLVREKEAVAARAARDEERIQRDADRARDAAAAAETRAFDAEAALAVARARIRQLETEAAEHVSCLAAVESRAASDLRAEQESCLTKISDIETRHQEGLHKADARHDEALTELKRLHKEELEDTRRRNSDFKTLEALAGQVQASAGAVKLLQSEMLERKHVAEVSREGHMEARERLVKELEHSARRAQQAAEDEVQRLQGTLMAMDQVMSALRGQNAGERERLRQEHMRMEALQGAMVAEVEAVRKSVDEERQRLTERCASLDREKREVEAAARAERDRLNEKRIKLERDREMFAALQVSASQAADEMARRHAAEEERINLARQSLEREVASLESRLIGARAELHNADHVRDSLERLREQDELERRRLKTVAGELERALEEVRARTDDSEERRQEAERMKAEALAASKAASREMEAAQMRSIRVEEEARRLDAERTSIAQARAQSATELSTSRRLKAELSKALATQQRQRVATSGGDTGARLGTGFNGWAFGRGMGSAMMPGLPAEASITLADENGSGRSGAKISSPPPPDKAAGGCGIPFTGIAAAEATIQAVSSAPPFPGLDVGRELGRLARRAADLRQCTREQSAFLSSSRAARFSSAANPDPHESIPENIAAAGGMFQVTPGSLPGSPSAIVDNVNGAARRWNDMDLGEQMLRNPRGGGDFTGGQVLGAMNIGLSSSILEELNKIERAYSQRSSALKEEESFIEALGRAESPVVV